MKARAFQDNTQKNRRGHNRSAKPGIADAGGVLYSSHAEQVHNLLGKNIVEESLMQSSAPDLNHSGLYQPGNQQLLEQLGQHNALTEGAEPALPAVYQANYDLEGARGVTTSKLRQSTAVGSGISASAQGSIQLESAQHIDTERGAQIRHSTANVASQETPGRADPTSDIMIQSNRTPGAGDAIGNADALPAITNRIQ